VQNAAGRELTQAEIKNVEDRIARNQRLLARRDPQEWQKLNESQRLQKAADAAVDELIREAEQQKFRLQRMLEAKDKLDRETGNWEGGRLDALKRKIASVTDGKGAFRSIETLATSIRSDALRLLQDAFDALDPRMLGLFENNDGVIAFVRALYGQTEGIDPKIVKAAHGWHEVANGMKDTFNSLGGKIGSLEDWAMPQTHSQLRIAQVGEQKWMDDVRPLIDRSKYVNEDGTYYSAQQIEGFLRESWNTLATNGLNTMEPGRVGNSMMANRHAAHRELHFKGPDEWLKYHEDYSGQPMLKTMVDHVASMARDTAMVEEFGPNPDRMFEYLRDQGTKEAVTADPKNIGRYQAQAVKLDNLWKFMSGQQQPVAREWLARLGDGIRNFLVSTRLGGAVISSIADEGTMAITAKVNNMSYMQVFGNELRAMNLGDAEELRQARRAGLAMETMLGDLNRWGQDNLGSTVTSKLAHFTMRASGLNAITDVRRRAFGVTMMDSIGHLTRGVDSLAKLDADDNRILLSKGVTDTDWQVWRAAEPEQWGGNNSVLTPDAIYAIPDDKLARLIPDLATAGENGEGMRQAVQRIRRDAALRLIGAVGEEVDMAVITPKGIEREMLGGGLQRGTWKGELARSVFLFKTTPISVVYRHWKRGLAMDTNAGKVGYIAALMASTTLLGAFTMQVKELIAGRDPRNLNPAADNGVKNWVAAFLQGGSFGIYGDFLFSNVTRHDTSPLGAALGPVAGMFEQLLGLTQGNIVQAMQGKDTKWEAEAVRFGKSNIPLANLWYTKSALDHLIFNDLQEYVSPGYLGKMKRRMQQDYGASYYWDPASDNMRAPDMGKAWQQ
jgi:hypothetical protein